VGVVGACYWVEGLWAGRGCLGPSGTGGGAEVGVIAFGVVEDRLLLIDGLRAWAGTLPDMRLRAVAATVGELLDGSVGHLDVVLLNPSLRAEPDPAVNVRKLIAAGNRVLVMDGSADPRMVARSLAAGAHGYLTRDHGTAALAASMRSIAAGGAGSSGESGRPVLSARERGVLMAYASGLTLESTARSLGISHETARTYLKRIKAKYRQAGIPVYTKLDLAEQARADYTGES
jgi:two-component system, NarL family, nitrate/nitrite response regulator NarL